MNDRDIEYIDGQNALFASMMCPFVDRQCSISCHAFVSANAHTEPKDSPYEDRGQWVKTPTMCLRLLDIT